MLYLYIHIESRALRIPSADSWYKVKVSRDLSNSAKDLKKKRTKHRTSAREKTIYNYCAMSRESVSGGFSTIFIFWPCLGKWSNFTNMLWTVLKPRTEWFSGILKDFIRKNHRFLRATETNGTSALFAARDQGKEAWQGQKFWWDATGDNRPPSKRCDRCAAWFSCFF